MSSQYNQIGANYHGVKKRPLDIAQTETILAHLGNIEGQEVLDLACGAGYFSQKAVEQGARQVVGLDISSTMIEVAQREHEGDSRFEFRVADCGQHLDVGREFDVVFAMWFLNYAPTAEDQFKMWQNMLRHLKPGGRCIGIVPNFDWLGILSADDGECSTDDMQFVEHVPDGVKYRFFADLDPPVSFEAYLLRREVYNSCAHKAGFVDLQWLDLIDVKDPSEMQRQIFQAWRPI